uniref:Uncharacterized protein n=1 Tax=Glossina palpalis gambiensis TaxID=67801 RepID=A0A1B0BUA1_9MUSC
PIHYELCEKLKNTAVGVHIFFEIIFLKRNDEATLPNFWRESDKLKTGKRGLIRCMAQFITIIREFISWPDPLVADENGYHPAIDCFLKVAIMPWSNGCIRLVVLGGKNTTCTLGCSKQG